MIWHENDNYNCLLHYLDMYICCNNHLAVNHLAMILICCLLLVEIIYKWIFPLIILLMHLFFLWNVKLNVHGRNMHKYYYENKTKIIIYLNTVPVLQSALDCLDFLCVHWRSLNCEKLIIANKINFIMYETKI